MRPPRAFALAATLLAPLLMAASCAPSSPAPEVDLSPVVERLARIEAKIDDLAAAQSDGRAAAEGDFASLSASVEALRSAALDLGTQIAAPISLSDVDLASAGGYFLTVSPPDLEVEISPGACSPDVPSPLDGRPPGAVTISTYHPAPEGVHCLYAPATDSTAAAGITFEVPAAAVANVYLYPVRAFGP